MRYIHRAVERETLAALYRASRIGLVTPLRDGINLVAKEYVAAQDDADPGVLILSRFAGAAEDLQEALIVNPYDIDEVAHAMRRAIEMTKEERIERHQALMGRVRQHDACNWMLSFLRALSSCREQFADNIGERSVRRRDADRRRGSLVAFSGRSSASNSMGKLITGTKFGGGSTSLNLVKIEDASSTRKSLVPFVAEVKVKESTIMKIAQIAPLIESVPPRLYGGTERIVSYLTEELVQMGHEVTLFASGDSLTSANLVPCVPMALRLDKQVHDTIPHYMLMLDRVRQQAHNFDILHFHLDFFPFPLFRSIARRTVTTLHGRQDLPDLPSFYTAFHDMPLVSISDAQRSPLPKVNFSATIFHGLPLQLHRPTFDPRGGYLAFLGRISPEKGPERAIQIARTMGIPLKIAAKVDKVDEAYFRECVAPLLSGPGVEFIGEINDRQKSQFLGEALALLFPIDWPEPFGLAMIEAMACGSPVLAFRRGSVPEIIDDGVTGVIVDGMDQAAAALPRVLGLDRRAVRRRFEERFSAALMAQNYVNLYRSLLMPVPSVVLGGESDAASPRRLQLTGGRTLKEGVSPSTIGSIDPKPESRFLHSRHWPDASKAQFEA